MDLTKTKDILDLTKLSLSTFNNIGQMARYRFQYVLGKELQMNNIVLVNECEFAQDRNKMIYHTCLAGLGVIGLFAFGIASLIRKE